MSRIYTKGYQIEYPEEFTYAGMPAVVKLTNATAWVGVGLTVKVGNQYYADKREVREGEAIFDISQYLKTAYVGKRLGYRYNEQPRVKKSTISQPIEVVVVLTSSSGTSEQALAFTTNALYGYIGIGQRNGGGKRVRDWFVNYPQSFDFYADPDTTFALDLGNGAESLDTENIRALCQVYTSLAPSDTAVPSDAQTAELNGYNALYLQNDVLHRGTTTYRLRINRRTSGVFLRWLDNLGQWSHYLFITTGRSYSSSEEQAWNDGIIRNDLATDGDVYLSSGQRAQQMSRQDTITLGAKLVDAETYDYLLSLISSNVVEMLANADEYLADSTTRPLWERVAVVGGSYARTSDPLQDFTVSIARRAHNSQML